MPHATTFEQNAQVKDFCVSQLERATPAVITGSNGHFRLGSVVIRSDDEMTYLYSDGWKWGKLQTAIERGVRVRKLRPGDLLTIQGE